MKQLLTDMRCEVVWTDKATMPIPLYERMKVALQQQEEREAKLVSAIRKTLEDNGHLADGDNCTLIDLKNILKELGIDV